MTQEPLDVVENITWKNVRVKKRKRESVFLSEIKEKDYFKEQYEPKPKILLLPATRVKNNIPFDNKITINKKLFNFNFNVSFIIGIIHVIINSCILFAFLYISGFLLYFMTVDIFYNISRKKEEMHTLIKEANKLYIINKCNPTTRVPALEKQCGEWDHLIKNGARGIKYTKIVIEACAGLLDSFICKFSIKTVIITGCFMIIYLLFKRR